MYFINTKNMSADSGHHTKILKKFKLFISILVWIPRNREAQKPLKYFKLIYLNYIVYPNQTIGDFIYWNIKKRYSFNYP